MTAITTHGCPVPTPAPEADRGALLSDVLVGYLLRAPRHSWPGMDGLLVSEVLWEYTALASARAVPDEMALCARHPELAAHIVAFFFLAAVPDGNRN